MNQTGATGQIMSGMHGAVAALEVETVAAGAALDVASIFQIVPIFSMAFANQIGLFRLRRQTKKDLGGFVWGMHKGVVAAGLMYMVVGTWGLQLSPTRELPMMKVLGDVYGKPSWVVMGMACVTNMPFFVKPCREALGAMVKGGATPLLAPEHRRIVVTVVLVLLAFAASVLMQNVQRALQIVGSTSGACLSYILPGTIYILVYGDDDEFYSLMMGTGLIVVGAGVAFVGLTTL